MSQDGASHRRKANHGIRGLELWDTCQPDLQGKGEGQEIEFNHMANDSANHAYVINP